MRFRVGDASGPLRIIREQQQALARHVEATDRADPGSSRGQAGVNSWTALLVIRCGNNSARLVENEVNLGRGFDCPPVYRNAIPAEVNRSLGVSANFFIQCDSTCTSQFGGLRSRTISQLGNSACESDALGSLRLGLLCP